MSAPTKAAAIPTVTPAALRPIAPPFVSGFVEVLPPVVLLLLVVGVDALLVVTPVPPVDPPVDPPEEPPLVVEPPELDPPVRDKVPPQAWFQLSRADRAELWTLGSAETRQLMHCWSSLPTVVAQMQLMLLPQFVMVLMTSQGDWHAVGRELGSKV